VVEGLPLLERERELARVMELVEDAVARGFHLAVVEGPPGAGKSVILSALATRAAERGVRVLRAAGLELERDYPFGVVRQLFDPVVSELDHVVRQELFAGTAAPAEALLTGRWMDSGREILDPTFALLHGLYWLLVGLTELGPLALVVDDVQWSDIPSLRFLAFAIKRSEELPLLVGVARRDLPASEASEALSAALSGPASIMRPAPLSEAAIRALLTDAVGDELSGEVVLEAERLTRGNPLYVSELAEALRMSSDSDKAIAVETLRDAAPAAVGRRVRDAIARLDAAAQAVASAAAILGDEVPLRRAVALAEVEPGLAVGAADALARADVLTRGEPLRFRHPLVREAVLESIEPRARAAMHGHAGQLLIEEGELPQRAALHFLESDPAGDEAVVTTLRAGARQAVAEGAPELAIGALRRALREPPVAAEKRVILSELALVEARVGDSEAFAHFGEAFRDADSLDEMADSAVRYALLLSARGQPREAGALIDRVLGRVDDPERRLMLEAELCTIALNNEIPGARERLNRACAGLIGASPAERLLLALRAHDRANAAATTAGEAVPLVMAALDNGLLLSRLGPDSPTYLQLSSSLQWMDALQEAERELSSAAIEARRVGAAFGFAMASAQLGSIAHKQGQLMTAEAHLQTAAEVGVQMGWLAGFPVPLIYLIDVLNERGHLAEADRLLITHGLTDSLPESHAFTEFLEARGRLRLSQGQLEQGIEDLEELGRRLERVGDAPPNLRAILAGALVPALLQADRRDEAERIADDALRGSQAFGQPRFIATTLRARALTGANGADLNGLQEAASIYERIGAPHELARTLVEIGSVLRRRRQPAAAREPLRRALDLARSCGARPLAERADHELRASGARPRRDRITGRDALTATEQRVAQLATEGMTNRQIAETLFVTRKTVESHLEHIFRKLSIHTRGELEQALAAKDESVPVG
jgi:DNA-binding CsgD family transcriptional regulator